MNPYDEDNQALLIRSYRMAGNNQAAARQLATCEELYETELGIGPGPAIRSAARARPPQPAAVDEHASIEALIEAGSAALSAGAVDTSVQTLRSAVAQADESDSLTHRAGARIELAEALIHSLSGTQDEGSTNLHAALAIAGSSGQTSQEARATTELGYIDFLRARYDRATHWLSKTLALKDAPDRLKARSASYLGSVESDRANYPRALKLLAEAVALSRRAQDVNTEAYTLAMLGRLHLLRGDLQEATKALDASVELAERHRWLAFVPWPQAFRAEVDLELGHVDQATGHLTQAFARACQLDDPCWEGVSARGLALAREAGGDTEGAFEMLTEARRRCNRHADSYRWLDVYILDAQCGLGGRHDHPETRRWIEEMSEAATSTGMKEMIVRAQLHGAAVANGSEPSLIGVLTADIENPRLRELVNTAGLSDV